MTPGAREVCYSLPRLITMGVQCTFCAYMWELYTTEFGWSAAEYGTISSLCSGTQIIAFFILGIAFNFGIEKISGSTGQEVQNRLRASKCILTGGTLLHWLTFLLLIILPIKWHGVKTPYVDSIFGSSSKFLKAMFKGPVALSSMASHKHWYRFMLILWPFVKFFWVILYIPMKVCFFCGGCCMKLLRIIHSRRTKLTRVIPVLETLESIPPPTCSACCNTTCCNNFAMRMRGFGRWLRTKTFLIYVLAVGHGVGVSMHELCNTALFSYIQPGKRKGGKYNDGTTPLVDANDDVNMGKRGQLVNINLSFFFVAQLLIIALFSLLKFYIHSRAFFTETFYLLAIMFLILHFPLLPPFFTGTNYIFNEVTDGSDITGTDNTNTRNTTSGAPTEPRPKDLNPVTADGNKNNWFKLFSLTTFHGTILFWMFSGAQLTNYVANAVLGGHIGIGSFGVLIFNASLTMTSWLFMIITTFGGQTAAKIAFVDDTTKKWVTGIGIACELLIFLLFYKHDWSWNKGNRLHYFLLIVIGAINSIFVTYTNIMLSGVLKTTAIIDQKWIASGLFYSLTNAIISGGFFFMFRAFGQDEIRYCGCKCLRIPYHFCFPTVYKTITGVFIFADVIAAAVYWLVST